MGSLILYAAPCHGHSKLDPYIPGSGLNPWPTDYLPAEALSSSFRSSLTIADAWARRSRTVFTWPGAREIKYVIVDGFPLGKRVAIVFLYQQILVHSLMMWFHLREFWSTADLISAFIGELIQVIVRQIFQPWITLNKVRGHIHPKTFVCQEIPIQFWFKTRIQVTHPTAFPKILSTYPAELANHALVGDRFPPSTWPFRSWAGCLCNWLNGSKSKGGKTHQKGKIWRNNLTKQER